MTGKLFPSVVFLWCVIIFAAIFWSITDVKIGSYLASIPISFVIAFSIYKLRKKLEYHEDKPLGVFKMAVGGN